MKFSWSSFQPCIVSVMNLKFRGRNFLQSLTCGIRKNFNLENFRLYSRDSGTMLNSVLMCGWSHLHVMFFLQNYPEDIHVGSILDEGI